MPTDRDAIGDRGQSIAALALTSFVDRNAPLFDAYFLGETYPAVDFLVRLLGVEEGLTPFFFVQVKATTHGYTATGRLKVQVSDKAMRRLVSWAVPTYIVGVDEPNQASFIVAALPSGPPSFPSLPTAFPINAATLHRLYDEVLHFWQTQVTRFTSSQFT